MLKLFQTEADIMLGKKNLVSEFYDELVCETRYLNRAAFMYDTL